VTGIVASIVIGEDALPRKPIPAKGATTESPPTTLGTAYRSTSPATPEAEPVDTTYTSA
jgi:hypothetical protein